ncbi:N-terminal domain of NEFA-interacting nuclear protein NIP30-domain-containing protein [Cladorrhinum sp. PSN332]|nr:N-terminal domain of NEFA-interacting nuclear protein NIP30-domain-containing protein [Cladorrhinum sp. PSN332]
MSRFVSAGAIDATTGEAVTSSTSSASTSVNPDPKSSEWAAVTAQLESDRKRREEARVAAASGQQEKSLYEVLQANKAAKQAAFEEASKLKNQFRALDDDEIEFLDEVRVKKREEEEKRRREVEEGLRKFREGKGGKDGKDGGGRTDSEEEEEAVDVGVSFEVLGRKRVRVGGGGGGGGKRAKGLGIKRKESTGDGEKEEGKKIEAKGEGREVTSTAAPTIEPPSAPAPVKAPVVEARKPAGGLLVDYGSDDDD